MKELIFLGAGASKEAGVPISTDMTREIYNSIIKDGRSQKNSQVIKFILGGLYFLKGSRGQDLYQGISIEELLNTLDLLSERDNSELNPFIASWHPLLNDLDLGDISDKDVDILVSLLYEPLQNSMPISLYSNGIVTIQDFHQGLFKSINFNNNKELKEQFQKIIRQAVGSRTTKHFQSTKELITKKLVNLIWVRDESKVNYLLPLIQYANENQFTIATLNYDNSIEFACALKGIEVNTGLKDWYKTGRFGFNSNRINLIKLHGSVDWALSEVKSDEYHPMKYQEISEVRLSKDTISKLDPEIIFGGKNKLTAKGPFLSLLDAFRRNLENVESILVIGYSFSDDHINEYFRNWINSNPNNVLTIINPFYHSLDNAFVNELNKLKRDRIIILKQTASEGILAYINKKQLEGARN